MKSTKYIGFIPWVLIGSLIGTKLVVPMITKAVDVIFYKNKYNNDAALYYKAYMNRCYNINVIMPRWDSKLYLFNVDDDKYPLIEVFDTTQRSSNFFHNPCAHYTSFYCTKCKKYLRILSFTRINGSYERKTVCLTVNRDDMNNPQYGTKENPVPVLNVVGVSEPIWYDGRDTDSVFVDKFYRDNVIQYLKYKMPKEEFERRFKGKTK